MKTIGICIPTYRRPAYLAKCLDSIIDQAQGLPVKLFVADDSCSDINAEVIRRATSRFAGLDWQRNPVNLGINENIRRVIDCADTDYVWLVGEDDYFLPGALSTAVNQIATTPLPFFLCNYSFVGDDDAVPRRQALNLHTDATISAEEFVERHLWSAGFMGACLLELAAWRRVASDRYHGTYYAHVGHIIEMLGEPHQAVRVLASPLVANRAEDPDFFTWRSDALGVYFGFEQMCRRAAERVPALADALEAAALVYREKQGYLSMRSLARMRADGILGVASYRRYVEPSRHLGHKGMAALLIALLPRTVFQAALATKRALQSRA